MKQKGFTLIELLVVVSIISLLSSVVFASLSSAKMKSRDAKRKSDLHQIQLALNLYYNTYNRYPICSNYTLYSTQWQYSTDSNWNLIDNEACLYRELQPYISKLPVDPKNNLAGPQTTGYYSYGYINTPLGVDYDLVAQLENTGDSSRCEIKQYIYHAEGLGLAWCRPSWYSIYMYADH